MIRCNSALLFSLLALASSGFVREAHADEPAPLLRESAWADSTAEIVLREDFADRRATQLEVSSGEPRVVHFAGRVKDAGHDGGPAYMVDFELPFGKGQEFRFPVPESDSTGIQYRFLLKVEVDPEPEPGSLFLKINRQIRPCIRSITPDRWRKTGSRADSG